MVALGTRSSTGLGQIWLAATILDSDRILLRLECRSVHGMNLSIDHEQPLGSVSLEDLKRFAAQETRPSQRIVRGGEREIGAELVRSRRNGVHLLLPSPFCGVGIVRLDRSTLARLIETILQASNLTHAARWRGAKPALESSKGSVR